LAAVDDLDMFRDRRCQFQIDAADPSLGAGQYQMHFLGKRHVIGLKGTNNKQAPA